MAACRGRRALVVVEGAEEAGDGATLQRLLDVLAPETTQVILTRHKRQVSTAHPIEVDTALARDDALKLLRALCGDKVDEDNLVRVQELLGGHPLALTWAGSQLDVGEESLRAFVTALASAPLPDLHQPSNEPHTLHWLYDRSVSRLTPEARRVLAAAGLLAQQPFPLSAAAAVLEENEPAARSALKSLVRHGLLRLSSGEEEQWEFTHALAHQFAHATGDTTLLGALGAWAVSHFESAVENARRMGDLALLGRALNHATALLRADHGADTLIALLNYLLYDGLGWIWALGRVDFARTVSEAAHAWLERALAQRPDDTALQRELSVSYDQLGDVEEVTGQLDAARSAYEKSLTIAERLAKADPSNSRWQRDLSVSYNKLGDVEEAAGQLDAARSAHEKSLTIAERLAKADPSNSGWQRDLSVSYNRLGDVEVAAGQLDAARSAYEKSLTIAERLAKADPSNSGWQRDLSVSYNQLGDVEEAAGQLDAARSAYEKSLTIAERLAKADLSNSGWQRDLSMSYMRIGAVLAQRGQRAEALEQFEKARAISARLTQHDPINAVWKNDLRWVQARIATLQARGSEETK